MTKDQVVQRIKDQFPEYKDMDDEWLYNFAVQKFPEYKENEKAKEYVSSTQYKITPPKTQLDTQPEDEHWYDFLKKGYNESLTGIAHSVVSGEQAFDLSDRDFNALEEIEPQ